MKKIIAAALFSMLPSLGFCHPASSISAKAENGRLVITIEHAVRDAKAHFIDVVKVLIDGKPVAVQNYYEQADGKVQLAVYAVPGLKKDTVVSVSTHCNRGGDFKKEIKLQ